MQFHLFLSLMLCFSAMTPSLLCSEEEENQEQHNMIYLSDFELKEIFAFPDHSYVYLGKDVSYLSDIVDALCEIDQNKNLLLLSLKNHMATGFKIGRMAAVLEALTSAQDIVENVVDQHNPERITLIKDHLAALIEHIKNDRLTLNTQILSSLKEYVDNLVAADEVQQNNEQEDELLEVTVA